MSKTAVSLPNESPTMTVWDRIKDPEGVYLERKPAAAGEQDLKQTLTAFANSEPPGQEAVLFIGIADNGTIIGVPGDDSLQKKITKVCADCYPPISHQTEVRTIEGKVVIAVRVPHSTDAPHFTGHAYIRKGSQSIKADEENHKEFVVRRSSVGAKLVECRGKLVKIRTIGKKLGNPAFSCPPNYTETSTCYIEDIDAHVVTLRNTNANERVFENIENFHVSREPETGNVMFLVKPNL